MILIILLRTTFEYIFTKNKTSGHLGLAQIVRIWSSPYLSFSLLLVFFLCTLFSSLIFNLSNKESRVPDMELVLNHVVRNTELKEKSSYQAPSPQLRMQSWKANFLPKFSRLHQ
jgi:hypothetical protein